MSSSEPVSASTSWTLKLGALAFASVLSSTLLIPVVRPLFAALHPEDEWAMHAFMSVNMLGGILGAPLVGALVDRWGRHRELLIVLALLDGALLLACSAPLPVSFVLALRGLQGAANIAGLSIIMGIAGRGSAASHGRSLGVAGAAIMLGVAAGAPIGALLLRLGPTAPLQLGGLLPFGVAFACVFLRVPEGSRAPRAGVRQVLREAPLLGLPLSWVGVERFVVGAFVVTFALYAHARGVTDGQVGGLFSLFLLPFAAATYPLGRLAERVDRAVLVALGMAGYGATFVVLGFLPTSMLPVAMVMAGLSSAAIYAPSLCYAASLVAPPLRTTSMALLNASGSLGMMIGTAGAGVASSALRASGWPPETAYPVIFAVAGIIQLLTLLVSIPWLRSALGAAERRWASPA